MATTTLEVTAVFLDAGEISTVGQNGFTVRKFRVDMTDNPAYPNTPEFQLKGDKVNLVDNIKKGQTVKIKFNLNGREYTNPTTLKSGVITSLDAWRIEVVQTTSAAAVGPRPAAGQPGSTRPTPSVAPPAAATNPFGFSQDAGEENDLPF